MKLAQNHLIGLFIFIYCVLEAVESFAGWVDPDTPNDKKKTRSKTDGQEYELIMSDEFNRDGRHFHDGFDPMWTGIQRSDDDQTSQGRKSLQYYNSSYIKTENGSLVITTTTEDTKWRGWNPYLKKYDTMTRHFRSGMVQTWNKFCYTGGILELSVKFPGRHDVGGLWPAAWLMGNLGRATFEASTNLMWPWSYEKCNRELQHAQEISGCDVTEHYNMKPGRGRGATEIDVIEVMPGPSSSLPLVKNHVTRPYCSMTLQLAPGIPANKKRPWPGTLPEWGFHWYKNITYGNGSSINPFFYGTYLSPTKAQEPVFRSKSESYQCDALSSMVQLNKDHWDNFHTFRMEWKPGKDGYIHWYMDDQYRFGVEGDGLRDMNSIIPNEPSYIILNTAISTSWGFPTPPPGCTLYDCKELKGQCGMNPGFCQSLPANFYIDHVRVYQNKKDSNQTIGCNPKEYPTKRFIKAHAYRYKGTDQVDPLMPVLQGGAKCRQNSKCGHGVTGECHRSYCKCKDGWTGPTCMVPDYKNDFPDWDTDEFPEIKLPFIPTSLYYAFFIFLVALLMIFYGVLRRKRATMYLSPDEDRESWL